MNDPLGFVLGLVLGVFATTIATIGLRRGRLVALGDLAAERTDRPVLFWYGVTFQYVAGAVCLVAAVLKATNQF